jgi:hypothetical protein
MPQHKDRFLTRLFQLLEQEQGHLVVTQTSFYHVESKRRQDQPQIRPVIARPIRLACISIADKHGVHPPIVVDVVLLERGGQDLETWVFQGDPETLCGGSSSVFGTLLCRGGDDLFVLMTRSRGV